MKYCLLALLCPILSMAQAQPLKVGDRFPEQEFTNVLNYQGMTLCLPAEDDQLVILDFWASWCASCKRGLEKLDSVVSPYREQVRVVLVNSRRTGDDYPKIVKHYNDPRNLLFRQYPTLTEDTLLATYFPHRAVPHYVWLRRGRVIGITSWRALSAANIEAALCGRTITP